MNLSPIPKNPQETIIVPNTQAEAKPVERPELAAMVAVEDHWEASPEVPQIEAHYSVDQVTNQTVIEVYDASKETIVREIPSEQARNIARTIIEALGRMMDTRA